MKALITEQALQRLSVTDYRFCVDEDCAAIYYDSTGQTFTTADIRVPVWQKHRFGNRMVCYCFGENEGGIRAEINQRGKSDAVERVRNHIHAGRCACEVRNLRGTCCLGDVIAAVKRVTTTALRLHEAAE